MRRKNTSLHAEVEQIVDFKLRTGSIKEVADRHHSTPQAVRSLICRRLKERRSTNVEIHVEQN